MKCRCPEPHPVRRIVLTGGPGAGKTAILRFVRGWLCRHVTILPESASILFGGGFPRGESVAARESAQRAIFHVQRELEAACVAEQGPGVVLCDRGTVDGIAYWPGRTDFWSALGTTRTTELERYDAVIHLRPPSSMDDGYNQENPVRIESAVEARAIDRRIDAAWQGHARLLTVDSTVDFEAKAARTAELLRWLLPDCCRRSWRRAPRRAGAGFATGLDE